MRRTGSAACEARPLPGTPAVAGLRVRLRALRLTLLVVAITLVAATAGAGPKIQVRGTTKLDVHATRENGQAVLYGTLADDAGQAIAQDVLRVAVTRATDPADAQVAEAVRNATPCSPANAPGRPPAEDAAFVRTDEGGRFCVRLALPQDRYSAFVSYTGQKLVEGAKIELPFDLSRRALLLRFDPEPRVVLLAGKDLVFEIAAAVQDNGDERAAPGLRITLTNEKGKQLATSVTNASGRASFRVASAELGEPGKGELRAAFGGDADTSFAQARVEIERRAQVELRASAPQDAQVPEDGIPLLIEVSTRRGPTTVELLSQGSVEVRYEGTLVGAAPVEAGRARPVVTFAAPGGDTADLHVRYVPQAPWYDARSEIVVRAPIRGPSPLRKLPLVLLALAVVGWLALGRRSKRAAPVERPVLEKVDPATLGNARVEVVRAAPGGRPRWTGVVRDAHDAAPVEGARVWVDRAAFRERLVLGTVYTDKDGRFDLAVRELSPGDELVVEGALHSALRQAVPAPGEISVSLVLRKRKILERLVRWARARGGPLEGKAEPTPAQVREAARGDFATADWADRVEQAAFGPGVVDADLEEELKRRTPDAAPRG